ncbi:bifunctional phosphopantothenoylcysteine decarboxylase/phosphopantothenate--cysteine ligase CoaBC [Candidatus Kapabacteria bacterium]|nr:bifunctional phosphopantothenoylcysteine decarboxylase/phosphopantothenate--cysteine ligase CoaBC [Candidatus Kapabacteria bacterium]
MKNINIVLGICGSISAYKSPLILRELVKAGYDVNCIITSSSKEFVTSGTLSNLSKNVVIEDLYDKQFSDDGAWHVKLAHKCDLLLIAPCSAATIGKLANGICDNALTTFAMALPSDTPIAICPAMDYTMWYNPIFQENLNKLEEFGYNILEPETGELSSGLSGKGRLPEISKIIDFTKDILNKNSSTIANEDNPTNKTKISKLNGKSLLITAGPTKEKIDDVRYISNFSSGKMGFAIANEALKRGALVTIVSGPVEIAKPNTNYISVESAEQMKDAVMELQNETDIFIMTAAVSDYRPKYKFEGKIKKENQVKDEIKIDLVENPDILKIVGKNKSPNQIVVGFALESENEIVNGRKKLISKNADLIVINKSGKDNLVFGSDFNKITIIDKKYEEEFDSMTKSDCAIEILDRIESKI